MMLKAVTKVQFSLNHIVLYRPHIGKGELKKFNPALCTVKLHLPGLIGTASHPDNKKIRIIGFFFGNRLHTQF
jgi:hypothetical protein